MNVFLDTNVVLDVLTAREPFFAESSRVWALCELRKVRGQVSAVSATNLYYVVRKQRGKADALLMLRTLKACVAFAPCDAGVIEQAIDAGFGDFEDGVQYFSAMAARADVVVTRDIGHYPSGALPVMTPGAFLAAYAAG